MSVCDGVNFRINYKIENKYLLEDYKLYNSKYNIDMFNIDILNIEDPFFNDKCFFLLILNLVNICL